MLGRIRVNSRDPAKKLDAFSVNMSYALWEMGRETIILFGVSIYAMTKPKIRLQGTNKTLQIW